ncbi:hypothetical protein M5E06_21135 [Azospirillum sp. A1-3]|uniref:hypothetical protein n=1 Tax=Azospirillum sp. A1-3 TaxID=185874 RepID=UPI0020776C33|nr:hypothetical protein [Azospirillum sp. A1-3]MCM8736635.1 hypothetical protein [Azospirillum sp. A1-3]
MANALNATVTGRDDWSTATFRIFTVEGEAKVIGSVRLWFGIHLRADGWWRLTHLPTGQGVGEALNEGNLIRAVADIKDLIDWDFTDPLGIAKQNGGPVIRAALLRHGSRLRPEQDRIKAEAA